MGVSERMFGVAFAQVSQHNDSLAPGAKEEDPHSLSSHSVPKAQVNRRHFGPPMPSSWRMPMMRAESAAALHKYGEELRRGWSNLAGELAGAAQTRQSTGPF